MEHYLQEEQPLDFDDFANQLLEQGAEQSPSHLHGGICGVLCGGGARDAEYCLAAVAQALNLEIHGELAGSCLRLAAITIQALQDEEFDFHPFLPDDEEDRTWGVPTDPAGLLSHSHLSCRVLRRAARQ